MSQIDSLLSKLGRRRDGRKRYKVIDGQVCEIARWTTSCSGCFEFNEALGLDNYPFDSKNHCHIGAGCHECGYSGKRRMEMWVPMIHIDEEEKV